MKALIPEERGQIGFGEASTRIWSEREGEPRDIQSGASRTKSWETSSKPSLCWCRVLIDRVMKLPVSHIAAVMITQQNF